MKDRVFPSHENTDFTDDKSFAGIDWDKMAENIKVLKQAELYDPDSEAGVKDESTESNSDEESKESKSKEESKESSDDDSESKEASSNDEDSTEADSDDEDSTEADSEDEDSTEASSDDDATEADDDEEAKEADDDDGDTREAQSRRERVQSKRMKSQKMKESNGPTSRREQVQMKESNSPKGRREQVQMKANSDQGHNEKKESKSAPSEGSYASADVAEKTADSRLTPTIASKRVISFTHPDQLTTEAIEAAVESGDEELKNTILAARHQKRLAIVAGMTNDNTRTAQPASDDQVETNHAEANDIINDDAEATEGSGNFKSVSDLTASEENTFKKLAEREGFPEEYTSWMLAGNSDPSEEATQIIELMKTEGLSKEAKVSAVTSMVKTAKLADKDLSYLKDYWINQLGYEAEWVNDLFTNKFYDKSN